MKKDKECPTCGGQLEDKTIQMNFQYKDKPIVIENIPAQVCTK
jgi:YgiT-type zinc finger domain-containing protein